MQKKWIETHRLGWNSIKAQKSAQETNERGVPYWEVYEKETGHVVHTFLSDDLPDAVTDGYNWLTSVGAEQPDLFKVRPKMKTTQVKDVEPDVAQNFGDDPYAAYERNSDRIDAIRAGQDATQQEGTWQLIDVTLNQPVETFQGTWAQADSIARQYETGPGEHNGHEISVRRA
jgi:hypothetical protein